ncbi:uncharacterized protein LACBIDRAFT_333599 [Laccaria bicolor S238N-H82]|uniref:Predicted protein n=1 Tax=Laccaria bicolor (strain S238N-H82 / ATCC MYA-4686) TaxID=486041 RepID=B0DWG7_LACBS|nr:uncharacterized protein LACBIDRAFT_333599 [Laccaria bicolor S238N-H82]EDR01085.1 predicted protein [Laccaria bicolor S238N-H82]|eukprot:XP_001888304.1 predicted protein [Laccaria bicolor S238N-H82]
MTWYGMVPWYWYEWDMFHWSIPITQSHLYKPLPISAGPDSFEVLTDEQVQLKKDVIKRMQTTLYNWYDYQSKKVKKLQISKKANDDPVSLLLKRLLGTNDGPGKRAAGWQLWGKDNFDALKSKFNAEFKASGKFRRREQGEWNLKASEVHEAAKKRAKDRKVEFETGVMSPEDAQHCINSLPSVLGPLVDGLGKAINMHVSVLCPSWLEPLADKEKFKNGPEKVFLEFLETCYCLGEVTTLASSFHLLESLALIQINWQSAPCVQDISIIPDILHRLHAPLRSLILHSTSIRPIMAWLISHDPPHPLTSLDIDSIRMEDRLMIGSYFKVLGCRLQDLKVGFDRNVYCDAIHNEAPDECPGLSGLLSLRVRSFEITNFLDGSAGSSSATAALQMLRTVNPSLLETVVFVIKSLSRSGELDGHAIHWKGLDIALNGSAYEGLRCSLDYFHPTLVLKTHAI